MAVKLKIRKGDKVVVITGKDKGKVGEVLRVLPEGQPGASSRASTSRAATRSRRRPRKAASSPRKCRSTFRTSHLRDPKDGKPTRSVQGSRRQEGRLQASEVIDG